MAISNPSSLLSWWSVVSIVYVAVTATRAIEPQQNYYQASPGSAVNSTNLFDKVSSLLDSYPVERVNLHCARTPPNLQALCGASLGWAPQMRLPNLLGHRTVEELDRVTYMSPEPEALHYLIHILAKGDIECKSLDQLKLLMCATVAPHCLDVLIPPCRQLCLRAKQGCRSALQRIGIEWPRFLDCRQFPSIPQDICIGRQPKLVDFNIVQPGAKSYRDETSDVTSTISSGATIASTTMTSTTTTRNEQSAGPTTTSKRRRKDKKQRRKMTTTTTPSPASETTAEPVAKDNDPTTSSVGTSSEQSAATNKMISGNLTPPPTQASTNESTVDVTPSATIATTPVNINTSQSASTTTQDVSPTNDNTTIAITVPVETTTTTTSLIATSTVAPVTSSITNGDVIRISMDPTTMAPVAITTTATNENTPSTNNSALSPYHYTLINHEDLGRNLCRTRPDWLIKAKLTDNQLMNAVRRHKFVVRSYRRIFGSFPNNTRQLRFGSNGDGPRNSTLSPASTSLDLSNSTWLYFPKSRDSLMGQLIGDLTHSRHVASDSPGFGDTNMASSHTYLIFGTSRGGEEGFHVLVRTVTYIVGWPSAAALKDSSPVKESSSGIVKVYRGFKLRGASFCAQYQQSDSLSSSSSEQRQAANVSSNGDNFMSHSLKPSEDSWHQVAKPVTSMSTAVTHPAVMADDTAMTLGNASTSTTARPVAVRTRKHQQQQPAHHRKQPKSPPPTAATSQ